MNNRYCVIMCGGVGSRFWPYSRTNLPKQFIDFFGTGRTLLQMTYDRIKQLVPEINIILVTNHKYETLIHEQLPEIDDSRILYEPARRNTAPCIAWAAYHINAINPNAVMMVAPSDHLILKEKQYFESIERGFEFLKTNDVLLTLGIQPNRPETGYGYIQVGEKIDEQVNKVKTFTEKPDLELAKVFLSTGEFLWNSGMFLWSVGAIMKALRTYASQISDYFDRGIEYFGTEKEAEFIDSVFPACPNISIDFAVMEQAPNVYVESVDFGWSDLGTWGALYENSPKSIDGNVTQRCKTLMINSKNNIIAVKHDKLVLVSGLNDYIVADAGDVLMIVPQDEEQKVRLYVNEVRSKYGDEYM